MGPEHVNVRYMHEQKVSIQVPIYKEKTISYEVSPLAVLSMNQSNGVSHPYGNQHNGWEVNDKMEWRTLSVDYFDCNFNGQNIEQL